MKKVFIGIVSVLSVLLVILFVMWRNTTKENVQLCEQNSLLSEQIARISATLKERDATIIEQNKKYQEILNSIEYTECESLPVSPALVEAAKELQK